MARQIYLATGNGLIVAERRPESWHIVRHALPGTVITSGIACEGLVLAGTTDGMLRSDDDGETWREANKGLTTPHVRWMARPEQCLAFALAGTEPAGIFVTHNGGASWIPCPEVEELAQAHGWHLPYSPAAGCVRGFAIHGSGAYDARVYAAVEVGGVLYSTDSGETWSLIEGSDGNPEIYRPFGSNIHPDVHSIHLHAAVPHILNAATGGGLYRSTDSGATWRCLYRCYCRALWVDPADPAHILFGPADGVNQGGRIEETWDGGETWRPAAPGLNTPWADHMVERFAQVDDELLAVLSNGTVLSQDLGTARWQPVFPEITDCRSIFAD